MGICLWCNTDDDEHDLQHLARYCYPEQIKAQRDDIDELRAKKEKDRLEINRLRSDIDRLTSENWQLKQALGYPIPAENETLKNPFRCGVCDARNQASVLRK